MYWIISLSDVTTTQTRETKKNKFVRFFFFFAIFVFFVAPKKRNHWPINTLPYSFLEKDFLQRRVRYKNQIFHSKRHHKRHKNFAPKEGKEKQRDNKRTGREIWRSSFESAFCCSALFKAIGFEEKTLNPSHLKDLEFKRLNERSFKSIVKRL